MHDIWNPWHGCVRASEGCVNCYMFYLDTQRGGDGSRIFRTQNFDYPLQRKRDGSLRVRPGELIRVCMTSDFFLEEADAWRDRAWDIMRERSDVRFFCSPSDPSVSPATCPPIGVTAGITSPLTFPQKINVVQMSACRSL